VGKGRPPLLAFPPGGTRVYAYDRGSYLLDVLAGTSIEPFPKDIEVGGFVPIPGRADRFLTGREIKSWRDYYWIDLSAGSAKH
jgi:hypothetical protein